jgi:hypothetical protein
LSDDEPVKRRIRDVLVTAAVAGTLSGAPSTVHALVTGRPVLGAVEAAGTLVADGRSARWRLVGAGAAAHVAISLWWAAVLTTVLPRRRTVLCGALAGGVIAALDLGTVGRRKPAIRALPLLPQIADHVAFGALAGAVLRRRREPRRTGGGSRPRS